MDFRFRSIFNWLLIASVIFGQALADVTGSTLFIDSYTTQYFRPRLESHAVETPTMSLDEVGAAVSVLLGFAPPRTLTEAGASKLNEVLVPNPFSKPRAVFMLEVSGVYDLAKVIYDMDASGGLLESVNIVKNNVLDSESVDIQLPDEEKVSFVSLDEPFRGCTDKQLSDYASWMGGSYVTDSEHQLNGVMTIPLAHGGSLTLQISKELERDFVISLLTLVDNVRTATQMHEDFSKSRASLAELLSGHFHGIKALQEQYGLEGVAQHGVKLLIATLKRIFDSLQESYKGQIVGIIYFSETTQETGKNFNFMFASQPAARFLAEKKDVNATDPEVLLVRRTLAWITGVILFISTLLGILFLLNMPLTRDTLLYSNVKLD